MVPSLEITLLSSDVSSACTNECLRWDHWVSQDRLRKRTEENQELAKHLHKEMQQLRSQQKGGSKITSTLKKKGDASARDSEERGPAVAGKKRGRDFDTEKVCLQLLQSYPRHTGPYFINAAWFVPITTFCFDLLFDWFDR